MKKFFYKILLNKKQVTTKKNLKKDELYEEFKSVSFDMKNKEADALLFIVFTHGEYPNSLYGTDGESICFQKILKLFTKKECPHLDSKPKIFVNVACRDRPNSSASSAITNIEKPLSNNVFNELNNAIVCFSTKPGHVSMRNEKSGSWFGNCWIKILKENPQVDLVSSFNKANELLKEKWEKFSKNPQNKHSPSEVDLLLFNCDNPIYLDRSPTSALKKIKDLINSLKYTLSN